MTSHPAQQMQRSYSFGPFILFPERQLLVEGEEAVRIGGRALDLLTILVERPGEVVGKRELLSRVWPGISVDEANLKVNMAVIRRALGESTNPPNYIATVVGRGYRFIAQVSSNGSNTPPVHHEAPAGRNHNLPIGATRIVGRAEPISSILRELEVSRLVSIVGMGGVGKTTVCLAVAERSIDRFERGVWLVDLSTLNDPSLVPGAIAIAIGLTSHSANVTAALCTFLQDRETLLVLDNCEHVIDSVAACVQKILASARDVKILTTSREPLCIKGERVRRLSGLAVPPASSIMTAAEALAYPSVQLFVDRASDRNASFTLRDTDAPKIGEICRRLDGVALAIELAATRIDAYAVPELLDRLDDRFRLLRVHRAGPERHRTLSATLDWSYELLTDRQRTLMCQLSIFAGSFSLAAACAVAADETIDEGQVVDDLGNLVAKSLINVEAQDVDVNYRMLGTTRSYAYAILAESLDFGHIRQRHAGYALQLAEKAKTDGAVLSSDNWLEKYCSQIDDIRAALTFLFSGEGDPALGVRLTVSSVPFWEKLSLLEECRIAVEHALGVDFSAFRSERDNLVLLLAKGATKLFTRGPLPEVKDIFSSALEIAQTMGDTDLQIECLRGLSQYDLWAGDSRASLATAAKVRELASAKAQGRTSKSADGQTGSALHYLGDLSSARQHLESFLDATPLPNEHAGVSRFEFDQRLDARGSLAMVLWLQGFPDQALAMAHRQLQEAEASNFAMPRCAAILLTSVCIEVYVGNFEETERQLDFVEHYASEHGLVLWSAVAACMRVKLHIDMGRPVDLEAYSRALADVRDGGLGMRYPPFLGNYGHLLSLRGDVDGALACIDEAISLYATSGQDWGLPEMLMMKGNFIRAGGRKGSTKAARDCYLSSIELARRHGSLTWELRSATQLVELARQTGGDWKAEEALHQAYDKFEEGFWTADLKRARYLLDKVP